MFIRIYIRLILKSAEMYKLILNQIFRYLPNSPANMKYGFNKVVPRRMKEFE